MVIGLGLFPTKLPSVTFESEGLGDMRGDSFVLLDGPGEVVGIWGRKEYDREWW